MSGEPPFYAEIDGKWHTIGEGEVTLCGLRLPYPDAVWTRTQPDKLHCGSDDPLVQAIVEPEPEPEPAAKVVAAEKPAKAKAKK